MLELEQLRTRAIALLRREARTLSSGELALLLQVPTHRLHLALHGPAQMHQVHFGRDGWSIPAEEPRPSLDDNQARIDG